MGSTRWRPTAMLRLHALMATIRHRCSRCRRYDHICGKLSSRGLCEDCWSAAVDANVTALKEGHGPEYERWKQRYEQGMDDLAVRRLLARAEQLEASGQL